MTFSALTSRVVPTSKFNNIGARRRIDRLIVHHTAGGTNDGNVDLLSAAAREVSATYCLLTDGSLVGIVPEEFRPWTSNSVGVDADWNSVTVETVNITGAPEWGVTDVQVESLALLAADLCVRYGWGHLDRNRVIGHRQVAQTACPGPYLYPLLDHIVDRANQILGGDATAPPPPVYEEAIMAIYLEATGNSSPIDAKNPGTSRIWAGNNRVIGGATYSGVWERSEDGTVRRLFPGEWQAIQDAYVAAGRKVPVAKISGNELEKMFLVKRAAPSK